MMKQGVGSKINYGWWIVGATFYSSLIFSGCIYFAFSLFVKPLQAEFGWDRSTIMAAFTFLFMTIGIASPFAGKAVDRYGPRMMMSLGTLLVSLGLISLVVLTTPLHYYVSYVIIGIGGAAMGPVTATAVVSDWFLYKRGLAIGIMSMGIGFGGLVFAPLVGGLIIPNLGWRAGYLSIGLLTGTLIPLALWIIRTKPLQETGEDVGPDQAPRKNNRPKAPSQGWNLKGAIFSTPFFCIAGAFLLSQFAINGTVLSQVPHLQDIGFPVTAASAALGGMGLMSALSKLFFGWLCDQINPKYAFSLGVIFMAGGTFILMMMGPTSPRGFLWFYPLIMGFGAGSWLPTMSILVSRNFGMASYGAIFGAVYLVHNTGVSTGPLFAGYIYDTTMGYHWAFVVFLFLYLAAIPTMLAVHRPRAKRATTISHSPLR